MAEDENGQEKTEEPTQRKIDKAKEDGQVPRSKELNTTLVLVGGTMGLLFLGSNIANAMLEMMAFNFSFSNEMISDEQLMLQQLYRSLLNVAMAVFPLIIFLGIASFVGPIALSGLNFSSKALQPKFNRLNPLKGIKRIFSMNSLVELGKAIAKFVLVTSVAVVVLLSLQQSLTSLGHAAIEPAIAKSLKILVWSSVLISAATVIIAIIDVPYQLHENKKKLRMTLQEVKDEMKDSEGKPEVKGRIRQLQREMAQRRMMEAVPEADVVITNPDHFSVAIKYSTEAGGAPVVIAKGVDHLAFKIREIAKQNQVELLPAPPLARAIYFTTELDCEIPESLYLAVAQVLAYIFQLRQYRPGDGTKPQPPKNLPVPNDSLYDAEGKRNY